MVRSSQRQPVLAGAAEPAGAEPDPSSQDDAARTGAARCRTGPGRWSWPRQGRLIVSRGFAAVTSSVRQARIWARSELRRAGMGPELVETVELLLSEVATNAVRHVVHPWFTVRLDLSVDADGSGQLEVAVHDGGAGDLCPPEVDLWDVHGRGLVLVESMSDAWGIRVARLGPRSRHGPGKWLWFRFDHLAVTP